MLKTVKTLIILCLVVTCCLIGGVVIKQYFLGGSITFDSVTQQVKVTFMNILSSAKSNASKWDLMELSPKAPLKKTRETKAEKVPKFIKSPMSNVIINTQYKTIMSSYVRLCHDIEGGYDFTANYNKLYTNAPYSMKRLLEPITHLHQVQTNAKLLYDFCLLCDQILFRSAPKNDSFWAKMIKIYNSNSANADHFGNTNLLQITNEIKTALLEQNYIKAYGLAKKIKAKSRYEQWLVNLHKKVIVSTTMGEVEKHLLKLSR